MANNFLENLKKDLENGDFNSEAAKKIIEIDKLANEKTGTPTLNKIADDIDSGKIKLKKVTEEEAVELNSEYEKEMERIKKQDAVNQALATLVEIEDMVKATINDMVSYVDELEHTFEKDFDSENPMFGELYLKIEQIKSKYNSIINN